MMLGSGFTVITFTFFICILFESILVPIAKLEFLQTSQSSFLINLEPGTMELRT